MLYIKKIAQEGWSRNALINYIESDYYGKCAGKLNFYVNAVDQLMKTSAENPTIGLLICRDMNQTEVQWAFQGIETPMGVATYDIVKLEEQLPSIEEIQARVEQAEEKFKFNLKNQ